LDFFSHFNESFDSPVNLAGTVFTNISDISVMH